MSETSGPPGFLAHYDGDAVAVATRDLEPGKITGGYLHSPALTTIEVHDSIPLGHKLALTDIPESEEVVEYGHCVAVATKNIAKGSYVHVHNVRSARWQTSIA